MLKPVLWVALFVLLFGMFSVACRRGGYAALLRRVATLGILLYAGGILWQLVLGRLPGGERQLILTPLWTYFYSIFTYTDVDVLYEGYLNIALFVPVGLLLPFAVGERKRLALLVCGVGCAFSLLLEGCQYCLCVGVCELDDLLHNTFGTVMGCGFYYGLTSWSFAEKSMAGEMQLRKKRLLGLLPLAFLLSWVVWIHGMRQEYLPGMPGVVWLDWIGLAFLMLLLIPNVLYALAGVSVSGEAAAPLCLLLAEQIGRYGCMVFLVFPVGLLEWEMPLVCRTVQILGAVVLLAGYWGIWIWCFCRRPQPLPMGLAILPCLFFLLSGTCTGRALLVLCSLCFAVGHCGITWLRRMGTAKW